MPVPNTVSTGTYDLSMLPLDLVERVNQMAKVTKALQARMDKQAGGEKRKWAQDEHGQWKQSGGDDKKSQKGRNGKGGGKLGNFGKKSRGKNRRAQK